MDREQREARARALMNFIVEQRAEFPDGGPDPMPDQVREQLDDAVNELARHRQVLDDLATRDAELLATLHRGGYRTESGDGGIRLGAGYGGPRLDRRPPLLTREQSLADWAGGGRRQQGPKLEFARIVRGLATGKWDGAEDEHRAISEGTLTAGGHMVPTPVSTDVIDRARNIAQVFKAGARTVPMSSQTLKYPRLTTDAPPSWRTEASAITDQAMVFDSVLFTAQSLAVMVKVSWELLEDADPAAGDIVTGSFARTIALELDRAALRGSGAAPEPRGIRNQSGVVLTSHGANGSAISALKWDFLTDAVATVRTSNFEPTAVIDHPRTEQGLAKLADSTSQYIPAPGILADLPRLPTAQIPVNLTVGTSVDCSEVYTGQWDQCWIGIRTGFNIRFLQERFADNGQVAFLASLRADVQLAQPAAFVVDLGVRG